MPYVASSVYFIGVMLGGLVFGTISDMYGRKPVVVITSVCYLALGIVVHFVESFVVFVILRAFIGVMMQVGHLWLHFTIYGYYSICPP